jgi:hypothetical protein
MAAQGAKVDNIDAVKSFRVALVKFQEVGNVALTGADSDIDRTLGWMERDQTTYWNGQLRKRHEDVMKCEEAVRQKRLFKGSDGRVQSAVDEMKALAKAKQRKEEAEHKIVAVKKAVQTLRKESALYKGRTQKLATALQGDIPRAIHQIDAMLEQLAQYLSIQTSGAGIGLAEAAESIAQAATSAKVGHERLRDYTPAPEERSAANVRVIPPEDPFFQPWPAGLMEGWQVEALKKLSIELQAIDPDQKIIVGRDCWLQPKIYLERREPAFDGDSGWYLGSAADPVAGVKIQHDSIRAGDLISARPDIVDLLHLPNGFLVVIDAGGPVAMLDGAGLDVWSVAMMMSPPKEEEPAPQAAAETAPSEPAASQ